MNDDAKKSQAAVFSNVFVYLFAVVAVAGIAFLAIPNFHGSHRSPASACINNLRQIDAAACQFALDHHLTNGDAIRFPDDLTDYMKLTYEGKIPSCSKGGVYRISKAGEMPTCSLGTNVVPPHVLPY